MRSRKSFVAAVTVAAMAMAMVPTAVAMAEEEYIAIPYMRADGWDEVAMTNDDAVQTGINIRMAADADSEVVGYLFRGGAAWVLNRGEEWSEVCSGDITGFVKNEYLLFGATDDVTGLADHYGLDGVTITWDGVKVFAEPDASAEMGTANTGDDFVILEDQGHWLMVEYGEDGVAYLSREDVTFTVLLETAYDTDEVYHGHYDISAEDNDVDYEQDYDGPTYVPSTPSTPSTPSRPSTPVTPSTPSTPSTEAPETNPPQTEAPETNPPQTEAPETNPPQTEAPSTDAPSDDDYYEDDDYYADDDYYEDDDYFEEPGDDDIDIDLGEDGWYDADTDTYYDGNGNVITMSYETYAEEELAE